MQKPSLLFVDDEPNVLSAISRVLNQYRSKLDINFASSGADAIDFMSNYIVDVVVTDMAMPEMDGKKLIYRLHELFPNTVPIVLSGHWDIATSLRELGHNVRFLSKPINHEVLIWALQEAISDSRFISTTLFNFTSPQLGSHDTPSKYHEESNVSSWISTAPNAE
ncbi:response regulator [Paramagnetospirillum kuznetsovii]|uniref:Response regulator n=1 Tax=Paramagnetospirillum kuznetsovii TaxID=2053833 RepID=A0A364NYK9_9PROT|nr:response regulator [Paramagnetospirillum kuznetsovii]RAU22168.1 response regulator [Paramagnetospirillum kuznetsovii]